MFTPPEPHPLDYDWRFTDESTVSICNLLPKYGIVLAVGAPSIARYLQSKQIPVILVDRQPFQGVKNHWRIEPGSTPSSKEHFDIAVVDPPWYPAIFQRWVAWIANLTGVNGRIIASIWPEGTRPGDEHEFQDLIFWLSDWADVSVLDIEVHYERPLFELIASQAAQAGPLSTSPGIGRLLSISVKAIPPLPPSEQNRFQWKRFVLNNYQLAVRMDNSSSAKSSIDRHPNACHWIWPYVSNRAPRRTDIGAWSSHNEVGIVNHSMPLIDALRRAFEVQSELQFIEMLREYPGLLEWDIPRPPYWRFFEWEHRQ